MTALSGAQNSFSFRKSSVSLPSTFYSLAKSSVSLAPRSVSHWRATQSCILRVLVLGVKLNSTSFGSDSTFDLFRIGRSKRIVDLCDNTIRKFIRDGLPCYRRGKAIFISKRELEQFIRLQQ